jgi:NADPH:quinone reductase-like Zn-dependent oxidoreductase
MNKPVRFVYGWKMRGIVERELGSSIRMFKDTDNVYNRKIKKNRTKRMR